MNDISLSPEFCRKRSGAYFTPDDVAGTLVAWATRTTTDRLLDPSCGDGQFIALHANSYGVEQNPLTAAEARVRAPLSKIVEGDFFEWAAATPDRFDCAAGNPPFIRYQTFKGETRARALALCRDLGASFTGLTSSWAPFLVATAGLLNPGGRMAFVVPAEIGHAPYAAPLMDFLVESFAFVQVIAVRAKLFPELSEDCWLLFADGFGGHSDGIRFTVRDQFKPSSAPPKSTCVIDLKEWRSTWNRRLRPYLMPASARELYAAGMEDPESRRFGEFAHVGIGYVSGDNNFFHLRPSEARKLNIPEACLQPTVRNGRAMPAKQITVETVNGWRRADEKALLLRLTRSQEVPSSVQSYLDSSAGQEARKGYKCRNRNPWYAVPDVQIPDLVLSYMSGRTANLVRNVAGVTCTNSVHAVRLRDKKLAAKLLPKWTSPFVRLSCELEGHALGGGMLKIEPREASRILFPSATTITEANGDALEEAVVGLQRWRHYVE